MTRRYREHPVHRAQLEPAQLRHCRWLVGGAHDQVRATFAQGFPGAAEHLVGQAQAHAGLQCIERADHRQQCLEFQHLVGDDVQPVFPAAGHLLHALVQPRHVLDQARGFVGEQLAGRGELQPIAAAVEQQRVETCFQLARRMRDRGRRLAQLRCRSGQAARAADRLQQGQFVVGQHVQLLRTSSSKRWYGKCRGHDQAVPTEATPITHWSTS